MTALQTKLWRDLNSLRAQVATIGLVVAIGVAGFVGMFSVHQSLHQSRDAFYRENSLADVFASVRRAPLPLGQRLAAQDGVAQVKLEVVFDAQLDLPGVESVLTGRFIGLALDRAHADRQGLNALTLKSGRWPERGAALEAVVSDRFATVRELNPGDTVYAMLGGRRERVHVVGTVVSPEYVFAARGALPDDQTFGIWWIDDEVMASAFGMQGAFNQVALRLTPDAALADVLQRVDRLLRPYGSVGAIGRTDQLSARFVEDEMAALRVMGTVLPSIFLLVSMFVLNVVLSRQVSTQRSQIAALKALGYPDTAIAWHYMQLAWVIAGLGLAAGLALSVVVGRLMLGLYDEVFRFHALTYVSSGGLLAAASLIVLGAATLGAWSAVRAVLRLRPAQAMQPATPPVYRPTLIERLGWGRRIGTRALMVIRQFEQRPLRATFTVAGLALAVALQISGAFWLDTIAHIMDMQFRQVQQGDVLVNFDRPLHPGAVRELKQLPGVLDAEPYRVEPVRLRLRQRSEDSVLLGLRSDAQLLRLVDEQRGPLALPPDGVVLSSLLARALGARVGDRLELEFRLWSQVRTEVVVVDVAQTLLGQQLYMNLEAMNRLARDGEGISDAALLVDPQAMSAFWAAVKTSPVINAVFDKAGARAAFEQVTARSMAVFSGILTLFAIALAVGITYNAARISLSERAWELASLRVLGMTRAEVSQLLLGELGAELLAALPLGALAGWGLAWLLMGLMAVEHIDFPVVIEPSTYASALLIVLAAGAISALLVRRQIDRLDLVAVLKVRE
ncbi:ABC transporter permease [Hydrogenophaga sp.]|uniref:ABC transporter permease n=1 Tax=Hydrogenophaga sp. TaxID=1904254 RepID=UPI0019B2B4DD|nr:ABC transporter permease [Hydrogenophaga sp.]MBD3892917.1 ABC transporter permease [Hydrogenophaga sp.]